MKHRLSKFIAYKLPDRIIYWVLIRAFSYTTTHSHPDKAPDEIGFGMLMRSWEFKIKFNVKDKGF